MRWRAAKTRVAPLAGQRVVMELDPGESRCGVVRGAGFAQLAARQEILSVGQPVPLEWQ